MRRQSVNEMSLRYMGWRVVAACFAMAVFCWGFGFYGQGVYIAALQRLHPWDVSLISGASTAYYLFSAALVIFVGDVITQFGARRVVLFGIACFAVSTVLIGEVHALWQFYAAEALMSFGWATMSVAAITTMVGAWFHQRRGLALNVALSGASVGGFVVTPALVILIGRIGFAPSLLYAVAVMVIVLVPITLLWVRNPGVADTSSAAVTSPANATDSRWTRGRALRNPAFWTLSAASALVLFAQVGFLVHQIAFLEPRIGRTTAGLAVAVTAVLALLGRLGLGAVIDRLGLNPRVVSAVSYLSQAAALLSMIWTTNAAILLTACAVFGFSVGNVLVFPALILQREFAAPAFPKLVSFAIAITQFVYALGPGVVGWLRGLTGSYHAPLMLCVVMEISAAVIVLIHLSPQMETGKARVHETCAAQPVQYDK